MIKQLKQMKRTIAIQNRFLSLFLLIMLCAFLGVGCAAPLQEQVSEPVIIKIVHTNDIHGRSSFQEDFVVGFEKLAALIAQEQPALILDVGDTFHGQAFATLEQGAGMAELLKSIKYDAMTPGNHDWNYGKDHLKELGQLSEVPILAGNVTEADSGFFSNDGTLASA